MIHADQAVGSALATLALPSTIFLTLEADALVVLDGFDPKAPRSCWRAAERTTQTIPYYNILWAECAPDGTALTIDWAKHTSKHTLVADTLRLPLRARGDDEALRTDADGWIARLLDRAYSNGGSGPFPQRRKRAFVLLNPHAGPGGAEKIWSTEARPILEAARMQLTVHTTTRGGEAVDLARDLAMSEFDVVIPCSGDGMPHEVFNGLAARPDARRALAQVAVCHIPCGSGNAMSCNLLGTHRPSLAALAIVKGVPTPLDLVSITQGERRYVSFLSQAYGMMADLDITTEHMRWMGQHRFVVGFLKLAVQKKVYPCDLACKVEIGHKRDVKAHYRRATLGIRNQQSGKGTGSDWGSDKGEGDDSLGAGGVQPSLASAASSPAADGLGLPPLKYGTVHDKLPAGWELISDEKLGSFYCGNMAYMAPGTNFFPAALANDGLMDLCTSSGNISLWQSIKLQMDVESGQLFDSPIVTYRKVSAYRLIPRKRQSAAKAEEGMQRNKGKGKPEGGGEKEGDEDDGGVISIDGERVPFEPFQAEVHRALGLTLSKKGVFEAPGPLGWDSVNGMERLVA